MPAPQTLGSYSLLAPLGRGRSCEVFLAVRRGAERKRIVALKRLREPASADKAAIAGLLREAELAAMIKHPKVVDIYEYGEEGGVCFLAMEYLAGQSLGALIRKQPGGLPPTCVARIGADVADGLHAAHQLRDKDGAALNVVHLDVSPSNIQITYDGRVLLVDFGLARAVGSEPTTRGKIGYLAPEQIARETPDARTDVFALGIVLWEAATGKRLYRGETREETLAAIRDTDAKRASVERAELDGRLDTILAKALARKRDDRYASAAELASDLRGFLADQAEATDTRAEISELMLSSFEAERAESDEAVARAQRTLTGEVDVQTADEQADASAQVTPSAKDDEEYYYYDDEDGGSSINVGAATAASQTPIAASPGLARAARDSLADSLDAPADAREIAGERPGRGWWIAAAVAIAVVVGFGIFALRGKKSGTENDTSRADESARALADQAAAEERALAAGAAKVADAIESDSLADAAAPEPVSELSAAEQAAAAEAAAAEAAAAEAAAAEAAAAEAAAAEAAAADKAAAEQAAADKAAAAVRAADKAAVVKKGPDKDRARSAYKTASRLLVTGDASGAIDKYREALDAWPGYSPAYRGLGLASERNGDNESAVRYYKRYLKAAPDANDADSIRQRIERLGG